ncbi:tubulin polyglutamylase TTLL4 isoform X2 [Anopheles stephensi]|uniref:tubulin polyglutamylase TTLL4 isoform X2 n=1 Tax=Anopheles stephensi TaxID=30069 RepID=UPI00165879C8|nr:tubulin polyglutamylase TTLL4 isoform X2 [Anopheles stephensi]
MACHANLSCVCTYITTKFATIMDFKQNGSAATSQQQQQPLVGGVLYGSETRNGNSAVRLQSLRQHQPVTTGTNGSLTGNPSPNAAPPLRRRCRSESLPMAPLLYGTATDQAQPQAIIGRSKKVLQGNQSHHANLSHHKQKFPGTGSTPMALHDHPVSTTPGGLYIESFSLQQQQPPPHHANRRVLPLATHDLLPTIATNSSGTNGQQQSKENVAQNHNLFGGCSVVNAKDVYMSELDGLRKDRRNGGYYVANELHLESRFARNLEANFATRATILERSSGRKLRARSESEPQELLYHSAHRNGGFSAGSSSLFAGQRTAGYQQLQQRHSRDNTLKRTRDTISPTLEADESFDMFTGAERAAGSESLSSSTVGNCQKDSPPSKMVNATEEMDMSSTDHVLPSGRIAGSIVQRNKCSKSLTGTAAGQSRSSKVTVRANRVGINRLKPKLASTLTSTGVVGTAVASEANRKSTSPQPQAQKGSTSSSIIGVVHNAGSSSPTPSGVSIGTSGGESVHTQDLDAETIDQSDAGDDDDDLDDECNGEDDDLDDEIAISGDEVLDDSLTDSEDNYRSYLAAAYQKPKSHSGSPSPSLGNKTPVVTSIGSVLGGNAPEGPLAPSLFPYVPPYLTFATHDEKGPPMPPSIHKVLKWKLTLITPIVVRKVLQNSGFRLLKKTNDWVGIWGRHMKSTLFKTLRPYQKFNHLPGSFQIGRKDRMWRNLQTQMNRHGKKEFGFMPRTYIIPQDLKMLRQLWPRYNQRNCKWIIKPPASARGTGIKVVNRWSQIPKRKPLIVQRYIERPLLINGSKFDLRLYVLVTSMNPLRVYMHTDGLARFASVKYSEKSETLNDRYMHLTNYSINKLSNNYSQNEDADACQGHKWTIKSLWTYFAEQGINVDRLWSALRNLVLRTVLAGECSIHAMSKVNVGSKYNCYELFGIDVLLDSELVPWLLEVNISPSLHSASSLDLCVKGPLVKALFNTVMYQVPPRIPMAEQKEILKEQGLEGPLCFDKRIYTTGLSKTERLKHNQFIQKDMCREDYLNTILEELTPDDVRCLLLTEDELARSAPLERILPAPNSYRYIGFTEHPRYYNRLLDAWEHRYSHNRSEGIALLQSLCERKVHLQVPPSTLKKDCNNKPQTDSTNSENGSQDSGIHTDQTSLSELQSQESSSMYQSQESIDQLPEDTPRRKTTTITNGTTEPTVNDESLVVTAQPIVIRAIYPPGSDNLLSTQTIEVPVTVAAAADQLTAPDTTTSANDGGADARPGPTVIDASDSIRLGDKIKLILDDALLLKQQECGGDTENTIIVQE